MAKAPTIDSMLSSIEQGERDLYGDGLEPEFSRPAIRRAAEVIDGVLDLFPGMPALGPSPSVEDLMDALRVVCTAIDDAVDNGLLPEALRCGPAPTNDSELGTIGAKILTVSKPDGRRALQRQIDMKSQGSAPMAAAPAPASSATQEDPFGMLAAAARRGSQARG
jgi:hypothetical protein